MKITLEIDEDSPVVEQITTLIFDRTQLVDSDANDLAWDILQLMESAS